jgi:trehalose-phosphatase
MENSQVQSVRTNHHDIDMGPLPSALDHLANLIQAAGSRHMVIFLDYDGTLTPIVSRPEDAYLPDTMRTVLSDLVRSYTVAIVSGRGLEDVRGRVHLEGIYYAGSHGFEIAGPNGLYEVYGPAQTFLACLDQAEAALHEQLRDVAGAQVERKHFAIAVHFRRVKEADINRVTTMVNAVQKTHPTLRQTGGKKVYELRPNLDWHKGTALFWLLEVMGLDRQEVMPLYIGDDVTDEDAFRAVRDHGVGIIVTESLARQTAARYVLPSTKAVQTFLADLVATHQGEGTR